MPTLRSVVSHTRLTLVWYQKPALFVCRDLHGGTDLPISVRLHRAELDALLAVAHDAGAAGNEVRRGGEALLQLMLLAVPVVAAAEQRAGHEEQDEELARNDKLHPQLGRGPA